MSEKIETRLIQSLKASPLNEMVYDKTTPFDDLVESVKRGGILEPISICEDGTIISGHRRVKAAKALGMKSVPVRVITTNDRTCAFRFGGKGTC